MHLIFDVEENNWSQAKMYLSKLNLDSVIFMLESFFMFFPGLNLMRCLWKGVFKTFTSKPWHKLPYDVNHFQDVSFNF